MKGKNIFIATGVYPPQIGGPAKYAEMLFKTFSEKGYNVSVASFGDFLYLPTGIRHLFYFLKILPLVLKADFIIALDTYSVCLPTVFASFIFRKKIVIRTGGDFLWENFLERTKKQIRLSDFYKEKRDFNLKEKLIFRITKFLLQNVSSVVFSTQKQREIFIESYDLKEEKTTVIENLYLQNKKRNIVPKDKIIFSPSRDIFLKNKDGLEKSFFNLKKRFFDISLDTSIKIGDDFDKNLLSSYILVVPSVSEISPNIVLEALSVGIPTVLTEDCFIKDRISDYVIFIKPEDIESISNGIEKLLDAKVYSEYMAKISKFNFVHTKEEIAEEFLSIFNNLK